MKEPMQLVWLVFGSIYFVVAERSKKKANGTPVPH